MHYDLGIDLHLKKKVWLFEIRSIIHQNTMTLFSFCFFFFRLWIQTSLIQQSWNPTQGSGYRFCPGHPGQSNFFINQNDIVLIKKQKNCQRVTTGFCRVNRPGHTELWLPLFFLKPGQVPAPGFVSSFLVSLFLLEQTSFFLFFSNVFVFCFYY
jgi:hypothetical protein